ncbi:hypothetical protein [Streptomyces prunicolor]|uniref:hypothetical protein n=1 Tax=Streptomyces prunicolor TaxID=67348 RepID=UPI0033E95F6A
MVRLAQSAGRRLGLLGAGLLAVGCFWINWGIGLLGDPRYGTVRGAAALTSIAPMCVWAWAWIGSGLLSCAAAVLPNRRDWMGLIPATGIPIIWAFAYCSARALGEFPQGVTNGLTWLVGPTLLVILTIAVRRYLSLLREVAQLRRTAARTAREGA